MPVQPQRKRAAHLGPERRRPQILDTAYELFLEHGFEGTSMDSIADAAGVSKPVVYDCFSSKDELFSAMLDREEERILAETQTALLTGGGGSDPEGTLIRGYQAFLRAVADAPASYRIVFLAEGGRNEAVAMRISRGLDRQAEAAAAIARTWVDRFSALEGDDADSAAELLGETIIGLAQVGARTLLRAPDKWTPEALGEKLGQMAWAARSAV